MNERRVTGEGLAEHSVSLANGRTIRYVTGGNTGPLVLLESGLGNTAGTWVTVQRHLSSTCRTISYDRAGLGGSDPADGPRSLDQMATDIVALLDALGVDEPVVLVGHSWGGPLVRLFAERWPLRARALMLVDPTITPVRKWLRVVPWLYFRLHWMVRLGGRERLLRTYRTGRWSQEMSARDLDVALLDHMTSANLRTSRREIREQRGAMPLLATLESTPSPVPIRFLVGTDRPEPLRTIMPEECARIASRSPMGSTVLVEDAGHSIPQERPVRMATEIARFAMGLPN
ncbi:alpha/beta hydrolase [Sphaerisporangium sp. NPDC051017]|uniref:alpha/beta fold hydrolase n=1 Tax=Sphaerisporangium sp. NPDC051017 TaxID=3154636 RepID=UPI0034443B93